MEHSRAIQLSATDFISSFAGHIVSGIFFGGAYFGPRLAVRGASLADGQSDSVLNASVTYFKLKPGDQATIVVPAEGDSHWAAIENAVISE